MKRKGNGSDYFVLNASTSRPHGTHVTCTHTIAIYFLEVHTYVVAALATTPKLDTLKVFFLVFVCVRGASGNFKAEATG